MTVDAKKASENFDNAEGFGIGYLLGKAGLKVGEWTLPFVADAFYATAASTSHAVIGGVAGFVGAGAVVDADHHPHFAKASELALPVLIGGGAGLKAVNHLVKAGRVACGYAAEAPKTGAMQGAGGTQQVQWTMTATPPKGFQRVQQAVGHTFSGLAWGAVSGLMIYGGYRTVSEISLSV